MLSDPSVERSATRGAAAGRRKTKAPLPQGLMFSALDVSASARSIATNGDGRQRLTRVSQFGITCQLPSGPLTKPYCVRATSGLPKTLG
jgi:hypothetical protein